MTKYAILIPLEESSQNEEAFLLHVKDTIIPSIHGLGLTTAKLIHEDVHGHYAECMHEERAKVELLKEFIIKQHLEEEWNKQEWRKLNEL